MQHRQLRSGVIRICNDYEIESRDWKAESILLEISKGGGGFDKFKPWKNVSFPKRNDRVCGVQRQQDRDC